MSLPAPPWRLSLPPKPRRWSSPFAAIQAVNGIPAGELVIPIQSLDVRTVLPTDDVVGVIGADNVPVARIENAVVERGDVGRVPSLAAIGQDHAAVGERRDAH